MKKLNIIPLILAAIGLIAWKATANDKYTENMQKNINAVYSAKSVEEIQTIVNAFERIGEAEKTKWEPFYYASYGYLMMAVQEKESSKKDAPLDLALKALEKAKAVNPAESEIVALEGFIHMIRVSVDPASRGQQYSGLAMQNFGKALGLNPNNPRALYLMAQMQYGTAQFFGSPTDEACGTLAKAIAAFDNTKPENPLSPAWGKNMALGMKENMCK
ncbi:MAG: hypothetical protein KF845_08515 [Cyclobacteriaceae bacterium]|nr:hypothetical protein [Cyclobacteriaceae bacterium]